MNPRERLFDWAAKLSREEIELLVVDLVVNSIGAEDVSFHGDCLAPYWSHTGDSLVEGQKNYADDE